MCCIFLKAGFVLVLIKVILICFLSFIPWPKPPGSYKLQCSRESSRVVRKIVQSKLTPILQKYNVELPVECPFHPTRDLFAPQQNAKIQHRPTQWMCGFCGKSFFEEKFLDMHFDNRHRKNINGAEDAICLAEYCDILRCDVLVAKDATLSFGQSTAPTDIEVWNEATALATARREVAKSQSKSFSLPPSLKNKLNDILTTGQKKPVNNEKIHKRKQQRNCNEHKAKKQNTEEDGSGDNKNNSSNNNEANEDTDGDDNDENENITNSSCDAPNVTRKQQKISELQRMKANCKTDEIHKLKMRCEGLVRGCIAGLLVKLSTEDFKSMESEMNKAVCWYLTCDRYWEDTPENRPFPWALVFILVVVLSLGLCLCYYIIWVLFDTDESLTSSYNLLTAHSSSPIHSRHHHQLQLMAPPMQLQTTAITSTHGLSSNIYQPGSSSMVQSNAHQPELAYSEEFFPQNASGVDELGQNEHYIYVTYPTEMKKRLMERYDEQMFKNGDFY